MQIKLSNTSSVISLTLQIMNYLLKRGFIIACLIHPVLTVICLNILCSGALHEALHLSFSRKFTKTPGSHLKEANLTLSAMVGLSANRYKNALICLSPIFLGVFGIVVYKVTPLNLIVCAPWMMNLSSLVPFSQDMRTFWKHGLNL